MRVKVRFAKGSDMQLGVGEVHGRGQAGSHDEVSAAAELARVSKSTVLGICMVGFLVCLRC